MTRCLFQGYMETFLRVREILAADDDGGALLELRQEIAYLDPDSRSACTLALGDALAGRPRRSQSHFCRMHMGVGCVVCEETA